MKHFVSMSSIIRTHACKKVSMANCWPILYRSCGISVQVFHSSFSLIAILPFFLCIASLACLIWWWAVPPGGQLFPQLVWRADQYHPAELLPPQKTFSLLFKFLDALCSCPLFQCCKFIDFLLFFLYLDLADATEDSNSLVMGTLRTPPQTET